MSDGTKPTSLICGAGEVGQSLYKVLSEAHGSEFVFIRDIEEPGEDWDCVEVDYLHICFPYSREFSINVYKYIQLYSPKITVIHSSVPVGTTRKLDPNIVYSPIRGKHPDLAEHIIKFPKFVGCVNEQNAQEIAEYFMSAGIRCNRYWKPEEGEAGKLWSTTRLNWDVLFEKIIYEYCEKHNLNFEMVYWWFTNTYNQGYNADQFKHFQRSILRHIPGKIGGHCVTQNLELLDSEIAKDIKRLNSIYAK